MTCFVHAAPLPGVLTFSYTPSAEVLKPLQEKKPKELVEARLERLMGYGKFKEAQQR